MRNGYIKLHRVLTESRLWACPSDVVKLAIHLALEARHSEEPKKYPHVTICRGELVTSLTDIADNCEWHENRAVRKWSRQKVARMLKKLKDIEFLEIIADTYGTHIKVCNYDKYQSDEPEHRGQAIIADTDGTPIQACIHNKNQANGDTQLGQAWNNHGTTMELNKNVKNVKNEKIKESLSELSVSDPQDDNLEKSVFDETSVPYQLSALLFSLIRDNNPKAKDPNLQMWCVAMERMIRIDKREPEEIESVIRWCQSDDFWLANILSTEKLRDKYEQLLLKMKRKQWQKIPYKTRNTIQAGIDFINEDLPLANLGD